MYLEGEDQEEKKPERIQCHCTRAFIGDAYLCKLGIKGVPISDDDEENEDVTHHDKSVTNTDDPSLKMVQQDGLSEEQELMRSMRLPVAFTADVLRIVDCDDEVQRKPRIKFVENQQRNKKKKKKRQNKNKILSQCEDRVEQVQDTVHTGDIETDFPTYWSAHGEFLVWQVWLEKYGEYSNTDMMDHVAMPVEEEVEIGMTGDDGMTGTAGEGDDGADLQPVEEEVEIEAGHECEPEAETVGEPTPVKVSHQDVNVAIEKMMKSLAELDVNDVTSHNDVNSATSCDSGGVPPSSAEDVENRTNADIQRVNTFHDYCAASSSVENAENTVPDSDLVTEGSKGAENMQDGGLEEVVPNVYHV